jgi:hypothetical protein
MTSAQPFNFDGWFDKKPEASAALWESLMPSLIEMLTSGTAHGRITATIELMEMARKVDRLIALSEKG